MNELWRKIVQFWNEYGRPLVVVYAGCMAAAWLGMPTGFTLAAFLALALARRNYWPRLMGGLVALYALGLVAVVVGEHVEQAFAHRFPAAHDALVRRVMNSDIAVSRQIDPVNLESNAQAKAARMNLVNANNEELRNSIDAIVTSGGTTAEMSAKVDEALKKAKEVERQIANMGNAEITGEAPTKESWTSWIKTGWNNAWHTPTAEWPSLEPGQLITRDILEGDRICFNGTVTCTNDLRPLYFVHLGTNMKYALFSKEGRDFSDLPPGSHCWEGGQQGNHLTCRRG